MVALQPRFLVLLGLCVAASSSALSVPPADAPAAPATVHESVHVPRSTPEVNLLAKVPHVARNTPDLPKVIPSKMVKRAGPPIPKLPAPATAMPDLSVPNHPRSVPELPAKFSVSKRDLRSVPAPELPVPKTDKPSGPTSKLPVLPQIPKRGETPALPKLPLPLPSPSAAMTPHLKRSHDANLAQPHLPVDHPHLPRDSSIATVVDALTGAKAGKAGSEDVVAMSPINGNTQLAHTNQQSHPDGYKSTDVYAPNVAHMNDQKRPDGTASEDTQLDNGVVHEHHEGMGMSI
ncbi:hypothetical protein C8R43DRAFT_1232820 [Mycena crocata]|nr:hypothetical protein C8R43DRAFT_1232820 [Mycena crocata]